MFNLPHSSSISDNRALYLEKLMLTESSVQRQKI
jgi:hypothetical protein